MPTSNNNLVLGKIFGNINGAVRWCYKIQYCTVLHLVTDVCQLIINPIPFLTN